MREAVCLSPDQLTSIHDSTVRILDTCGIDLRHTGAADLMKKKGFRIDGTRLFINENQLMAAVASTPDQFNLSSVISGKTVAIGKEHFILTSTSGATSVIEKSGHRRNAVMTDYENFLKLNHSSDVLTVMSPLIVLPADIPQKTAHLDLMIKALAMTDKPCLAVAMDPGEALDSLKIISFCKGTGISDTYDTVFNINVLSPLGFASDSIEALMSIAGAKQPMTITNMAMCGSTAPIKTADAIVMGNAEILGGIVLVQAIQPGLPVIYGSTSCATDMKTMIGTLGTPETLQIQRAMIDLANYYGLICRTGGSLTDAHLPDGKAMSESALTLENAIGHGAHFIMHACGMMSSYLGAGFEKWIMDEENCRVLVRSLEDMDFKTVDVEGIGMSGSRGGFLTHPDTVKFCRSLYRSTLSPPVSHDRWLAAGGDDVLTNASKRLQERLESYERPEFGESLEKELTRKFKDHC